MNTELRVYVVDTEEIEDNEIDLFKKNKCSNDVFMTIAEEQGTVFTLPKFQDDFNKGEIYIDSDFTYIRFIEVEVN